MPTKKKSTHPISKPILVGAWHHSASRKPGHERSCNWHRSDAHMKKMHGWTVYACSVGRPTTSTILDQVLSKLSPERVKRTIKQLELASGSKITMASSPADPPRAMDKVMAGGIPIPAGKALNNRISALCLRAEERRRLEEAEAWTVAAQELERAERRPLDKTSKDLNDRIEEHRRRAAGQDPLLNILSKEKTMEGKSRCMAEPAVMPQLRTELDRLEKELLQVTEMIGQLAAKLGPVLKTCARPVQPECKPSMDGCCLVVAELRERVQALSYNRRDLERIMEDLDL